MENNKDSVSFSVVIPTRDRPKLFKLALDSVLAQNYDNFDIHVVNDGSSGQYLDEYQALENEYGKDVHFHYLVHRPNGHGQSYSMNYGADQSNGKYLCFLDDDDFWIDNEHLSNAAKSITGSQQNIDLYYTNQIAYFSDGKRNTDRLWLESLVDHLQASAKDEQGGYLVGIDKLLRAKGFAHLNCSIFSRNIYQCIKGMDENIRYECDRDIYIKSLDVAKGIIYNPAFISQHHIPDIKDTSNMSTAINIFEKKIFQFRVYDKGILLSQRPEVVRFCRKGKGYELKHLTQALVKIQNYNEGCYYAREALGADPTFKWAIYCIYLTVKKWL